MLNTLTINLLLLQMIALAVLIISAASETYDPLAPCKVSVRDGGAMAAFGTIHSIAVKNNRLLNDM